MAQKEDGGFYKKPEFSGRNDSDCVYRMFWQFKEFWPEEIDNFKKTVNQYPFVDLACGDYHNCYSAIMSLSKFMKNSNINSYIGVDRYNINENSNISLIKELSSPEIFFSGTSPDNPQIYSVQELQPELSKNIILLHQDMLDFLKQQPSRSIKILSIGGFADIICDFNNPYRKDVVKEIQRVLSSDGYFLCAGSFLNVEYHSNEFNITEINKEDLDWLKPSNNLFNSLYWPCYKLYKASESL